MPIRKKGNSYYWGSKGPFSSREKAEQVARAAHASGYEGSMEKEGDGGGDGGAFDGLSGTVFTSSHAGIFTPTFSGSKVRRIHHKNRHRQDKKRHKLMGQDKKNGVDKLIQFLQDGSPHLHKRVPDKDMSGSASTHNSWRGINNPKRIDWVKRQEGISEIGDHPTMGMNNSGDGKMAEAGTAATYPSQEDPTAAHHKNPVAPRWNNNTIVQKEDEQDTTRPYFYNPDRGEERRGGTHFPPEISLEGGKKGKMEEDMPEHVPLIPIQNAGTGGLVGIGPPTHQNTMAAVGKHPQAAYTEKFDDDDKKQQLVAQNDFERKVKQHRNKEDDPGVEQPRAAGATAGMGDYPNSNMQMMEKAIGALLAGAAKGAVAGAAKFLNPIPDEIPDPSAQTPHQEEEWNLAGRDNPLTPDVEKAWGSGPDSFEQDDLHRGGDKDISDDDEYIDEKQQRATKPLEWIPEDETKVKAEKEWLENFQALHKSFVARGHTNPILAALLAYDIDNDPTL